VNTGNLCIALLHSPVYDRKGNTSVTSIVNADIHDIARCSRTFDVKRFYIVTPIAQQQTLARKILRHWQDGYGSHYNPDRKEAFSLVYLKGTLDEVLADMTCRYDAPPHVIATGARIAGGAVEAAELRERLNAGDGPFLLLFGTGWGLTAEVIAKAEYRLAPIRGTGQYNHLSVRSAVAIVLDRLRGS
jgi:hypothetical protein